MWKYCCCYGCLMSPISMSIIVNCLLLKNSSQ
jgi:hypothetical protein